MIRRMASSNRVYWTAGIENFARKYDSTGISTRAIPRWWYLDLARNVQKYDRSLPDSPCESRLRGHDFVAAITLARNADARSVRVPQAFTSLFLHRARVSLANHRSSPVPSRNSVVPLASLFEQAPCLECWRPPAAALC